MASGSSLQQQQPQRTFQQPGSASSSPYQCKECGLALNSPESLDVHLQYHKENLLKHWAVQAAASSEETNNNMTKVNSVKREFNPSSSVTAAADSSDMQKKSPEYHRATPEGNGAFGHPPTPQSFQSGSSPYQSHDNSAFSPNFQNSFAQIKSERNSPPTATQQQHFSQIYQDQQQYFGVDANQSHYGTQEMNNGMSSSNKAPTMQSSMRYHPYQQAQQFERPKSQSQVLPVSPAYPPQPTPSPSPKQCDKCGYVCESAAQLIDHLSMAHPPTPASLPYQNSHAPHAGPGGQHFMFEQQPKGEEDASQSEILDLDSHKVVHPVYGEDDCKRQDVSNPHSVTAMLGSWPPHHAQPPYHHHHQQEMFDQKLFQAMPEKMFQPEQKLFQPHQGFVGNGVSSSSSEMGGPALSPQQSYRPFEHLPSQASTVITSTQVPGGGGTVTSPAATTPPVTKAANWKSNEARRPKTYNCTACNKWFTSSGHLKRHYNTTLHKNAVKSSNQPDPASLPISAHHHPARDHNTTKEDRRLGNGGGGGSPEDSRDEAPFERLQPLLQPPTSAYDRQPAPPNIHHGGGGPMGVGVATHHSPGGVGDPAGLSPGGLLPMPPGVQHGFNMAPPALHHQMDGGQFQMYPNESAPHVTQATAISNHNTIGEFHYGAGSLLVEDIHQPLPSFAQFQAHRFGVISYGSANVGGGGSATTPYTTYFMDQHEQQQLHHQQQQQHHDQEVAADVDYKLTVMAAVETGNSTDDGLYSPGNNNNVDEEDDELSAMTVIKDEMDLDESKLQLLDDGKIGLLPNFEFMDVPPAQVGQLQPQREEPRQQPTAKQRRTAKSKQGPKQDYEEGSPLISSTVPSGQEGKTKCFDCDKVFNRPCYLTQHNKTCHNGDKPFKCTRCGKRFSSEDIYQEHAAKHAGEKPHKCEICPKQFNHKTDLRRHMCCHTGRKPYVCPTCNKGFIRRDHMVKHMEAHQRKSAHKAQAAALRA